MSKVRSPTELLRVAQVAKALALSKDTVRRLIALPVEHWIGLGFDRAVAVAAAADRQQRKEKRRAAREVGAGRNR